jgi:hypothetical protein
MKLLIKHGSTSNVIRVFIQDSASTTGAGKTGLTIGATSPVITAIASNQATGTVYTGTSNTLTVTTAKGTWQDPGAGKVRFTELSSADFPGIYELHLDNALFSVASAKSLIISIQATGAAPVLVEIQLDSYDVIADAVWDEPYSGHTTAGTFGKLMDILRKANYVTESQAGSGTKTNTKFDTDLSGYADDFFNGQTLLFTEGTLAGQSSVIEDFDGTTGDITLDSPMTAAPATGNVFVILPMHVHPSVEIGQAVLDKRLGESGRIPYVSASLSTSTSTITGFNGYKFDDKVTVQTTGGGFTAGTTYYVLSNPTPTTFQLATSSGGTAITPSSITTVIFMPIEERTVRSAVQYLRNRVNLASSTLTVYSENDTVASWTSSVSTSGTTTPITESNPVD